MFFSFYMPVKVIGGENVVAKNGDIFSAMGKKCLIMTGKTSAKKCGALDEVTKVLNEQNIEFEIYDQIGENPLVSKCYEAGLMADKIDAEFIIGIGGGSVLDACKASAIYASNPQLSKNDIYGDRNELNKPLPKILIGTTAGTGSEVSAVSVMTSDETGIKKSISGNDCYGDVVFADSRYTCSMPYDITVSTALDAMFHVAEGFFTGKITDTEYLFAEKCIPMITEGIEYLHRTKEVPTIEIREKLYCGSLYAGVVLNKCGTGFPHPLGYVLTQYCGIPHGKACAAFAKPFFERAEKYQKENFDKFISLTGKSKDEFLKMIVELTDLKDIKFTREEMEKIAERWNTPPKNFIFSPGGMTKEEAIEIFLCR